MCVCVCVLLLLLLLWLFHILSQCDQKPADEQSLRYVMGVQFRKFLSEWDAQFLRGLCLPKASINLKRTQLLCSELYR